MKQNKNYCLILTIDGEGEIDMKKLLMIVAILLSIVAFIIQGVIGVVGFWSIPFVIIVAGLMLFTALHLLKYLFMGGIVIVTIMAILFISILLLSFL